MVKRISLLLVAAFAVAAGLQSSAGATTTPFILFGPLVQEDGYIGSWISLHNPGDTTSNATIRYYNMADGTLATTQTASINPRGQVIFPCAPARPYWADFLASVEIEVTSGPNLVGGLYLFSPEYAVSDLMPHTVSTKLYTPDIEGDGISFESEIALQNPTTGPVTANVAFHNPDGTLAAATTILVAPHGAKRLEVQDYVSLSTVPWVSVEVTVTSGEGLVGTVYRWDASVAESEMMAMETAATLYAPIVIEGLSFNTYMLLSNPNDAASAGTVTFYNVSSGTLAASTNFSLPPHGSRIVPGAGLLPTVPTATTNVNAKIQVTSGGGIVAEAVVYHPNEAFGYPLEGITLTRMIGLVMEESEWLSSTLSLYNPSDTESVSALLSFYNLDGTLAATDTVTVAPNATAMVRGSTYSPLWATINTTADVTVTAGPGLVGNVLRYTPETNGFLLSEPTAPLPPQSQVEPPQPVDTDGDGITDDVDVCPTVPGKPEWNGAPSAIFVKARVHKVNSNVTFPSVEDQILSDLDVYLFAIDPGSISPDDDEENESTGTCGGYNLLPRNYQVILNTMTPVAVKHLDANGTITFYVCPGKYLLIGRQIDGTLVGKKVGWVESGRLKKKMLKMLLVNTKKTPATVKKRQGSDLWVTEPAMVTWTDPTEYYPFIFESSDNWNVTVRVYPPAGFVADYDQISTAVDSTKRCIQFAITDLGSEWVPTDVVLTIEHQAATEVIPTQVDVIRALLP